MKRVCVSLLLCISRALLQCQPLRQGSTVQPVEPAIVYSLEEATVGVAGSPWLLVCVDVMGTGLEFRLQVERTHLYAGLVLFFSYLAFSIALSPVSLWGKAGSRYCLLSAWLPGAWQCT